MSKPKLSKGQIRAIIVAAVSLVLALSLIITNAFVPVKYLFSYTVTANGRAAEGVMRVRFVDVGYGDCTVVELPDGKCMVIDAGDGAGTHEARILKFLNKSGIKKIDYLICTSVNGEHCGGMAELVKFKDIGKIYMPYCSKSYVTDEYHAFVLAANMKELKANACEYGAGESNLEYNYSFKFLSPSAASNPYGEYAQLNANPSSDEAKNNASAILWLEYAGTGILFGADSGGEALQRVCTAYAASPNQYPVILDDCKILKLSSHGSNSAVCANLTECIQPEVAVVSVGKNGQACPADETLLWAAGFAGDNVYRTDTNGTVTIDITADGYNLI